MIHYPLGMGKRSGIGGRVCWLSWLSSSSAEVVSLVATKRKIIIVVIGVVSEISLLGRENGARWGAEIGGVGHRLGLN